MTLQSSVVPFTEDRVQRIEAMWQEACYQFTIASFEAQGTVKKRVQRWEAALTDLKNHLSDEVKAPAIIRTMMLNAVTEMVKSYKSGASGKKAAQRDYSQGLALTWATDDPEGTLMTHGFTDLLHGLVATSDSPSCGTLTDLSDNEASFF